MPIPLATTTITVVGKRPQSGDDPDADGYDTPAPEDFVLATAVRACISAPNSARKGSSGADSSATDETESYALRCDVFTDGLSRFDQVTDETTGVVYQVDTVMSSRPTQFGLDHIHATLKLQRGLRGNSPS